MDSYTRYQEARNASWRTLIKYSDGTLPVNVEKIARELDITILPMPKEDPSDPLSQLISQLEPSPCKILQIDRHWHLFISAQLSSASRRFCIAHALGHILLRHACASYNPKIRYFQSETNPGDLQLQGNDREIDADIFALRLLAPACAVRLNPDILLKMCGLPPTAELTRFERIMLLNDRAAYFTHPLEKAAEVKFTPFVQTVLKRGDSDDPDFFQNKKFSFFSFQNPVIRRLLPYMIAFLAAVLFIVLAWTAK